MNKFLKITAISFAVIALAACGGGDKGDGASGKAAAETSSASSNSGYSKADFMKACTTSMTETQCDCYVDFYQSIGLNISDLGDSDKVQAAMKNLKPKQAMKVAKCVQ